jgi:hypothetical protein
LFIATFVAAGFGILMDEPTRESLKRSVAEVFDVKERQCRQASVAVGSLCPAGCAARPIGSSERRTAPPECHSELWVKNCGVACEPEIGFERLQDGGLIDAGRLVVTLRTEPDAELTRELTSLGVTLTPRFDGLDRYDAETPGGSVQKIKKRLSALPQIASAEYVFR